MREGSRGKRAVGGKAGEVDYSGHPEVEKVVTSARALNSKILMMVSVEGEQVEEKGEGGKRMARVDASNDWGVENPGFVDERGARIMLKEVGLRCVPVLGPPLMREGLSREG